MNEFEMFKKYLNNETLTDEEVRQIYLDEKRKHETEVNKLADGYSALDMNLFIERIGGYGKIEEMKRINEKADKYEVVDGRAVPRETSKEDLEQWKKGFMEGFEEAYKRLMGNN